MTRGGGDVMRDRPSRRERKYGTGRPVRGSGLALALLLPLVGLPARASEPTCPAGEITLSTNLLTASRRGAGADRLSAPASSFVLPAGISIAPATEALTIVVEGDHQPLYQATIPAGGLIAQRGGTAFVLSLIHI